MNRERPMWLALLPTAKTMRTLLLIAGFLVLGPGIAQAASSDLHCSEAHTRVERTICADPLLTQLDAQLDDAFRQDLAEADPAEQRALTDKERHWLWYTRDRCGSHACLKEAYSSQLTHLRAFRAAGGSRYSLLSWGRQRPLCLRVFRYLDRDPDCNRVSEAPVFTPPSWKALNPKTHERLLEAIFRYQTRELRSGFMKPKPVKPPAAWYRAAVRHFLQDNGQIRVWRTRLFSPIKQRYFIFGVYGEKRYRVPRGVQTLVELRTKVSHRSACGPESYYIAHRLFFVTPDLKRIDTHIPREISQVFQYGALRVYRHGLYLVRNQKLTIDRLRMSPFPYSYPSQYCAYGYKRGEK